MRHVWTLTWVVALFASAIGAMLTALPQACLALGFRSADIGLIGAAGNLGYGAGCLLWGRLFRRMTGKHVLQAGIATTIAMLLVMASGRSVPVLVGAQVLTGLASAATWPFASAWLLDFQSEGLSRTRLLRHYNLAWTNGLAAGLYLTGLACRQGYVLESFYGAASVAAAALFLATLVRATRPAGPGESGLAAPAPAPHRVGRRLLAAGLLASITAIATRTLLVVNYPELNAAFGFEADRMGLLTGTAALCQMLAFGLGAFYEPWLGLRRVYVLLAMSLAGSLAAFAYLTPIPALLAATALSGVASAMAFQASILAATGHCASARTGTTLHESLVGFGGMAPFAAGWLATTLKRAGWPILEALRAPFLLLAAVILAVLAIQLVLVGGRSARRLLGEDASERGSGGGDVKRRA